MFYLANTIVNPSGSWLSAGKDMVHCVQVRNIIKKSKYSWMHCAHKLAGTVSLAFNKVKLYEMLAKTAKNRVAKNVFYL